MKTLFTTFCVTLLASVGLSQSPGGVSSGLTVWLKPDAIAPVADGTGIASWNDASGLANTAAQTTVAARPQYYNNVFNGHGAIRTSSTRFFTIDFSEINDTNYTIITVNKRLAASGGVVGLNGATSSTGLAIGYAGSTLMRHSQYANWVNTVVEGYSATTELPTIMAGQFDELVGKRSWRVRDGVSTSRSGTNKTHYSLPGNGRIGRGMANDGFTGYIAEVIVYNRVLSAAELKSVHTYLSVKYGLSVPMADHSYPVDAMYQNDLFGIGYDSGSALNQIASESAGLDDVLRISNPSSVNNGDYLICGNDAGPVSFESHVGSDCAVNSIMARDWKFRHVGDFGSVDLRFDLTGVMGFTASELHLLIDLDGDGYDDETPIEGTYSAPYFTAAGVTVPTGAVATVCTVRANYYAVLSGLTSGAIWSDTPGGAPGFLNTTCAGLSLTVTSGKVVNNDWATLTCNNLMVEAASTFNAGAMLSQNINVVGNITVNGVWNNQNCTLNMEGTSAQAIAGTGYLKVQNWNVINATGVNIQGLGVILYGNMGVTDGGVLNTNNKLTLWSDINGTGEIQSLSAGTINGEVFVKRYRPAATGGWVNMSSSLQAATIQDWNDNLVLTGFTGADYFDPAIPAYAFNSFIHYDESLPGGKDLGYVGATNVTDALVPGAGYMVYMPTGARTVDARGTINQGTMFLPVTFTSNGTGAGWNMVGNPYPATIDWDAESWTKTNMNDAVYVYRSNINQYAAYVNGVATNGGSELIAPGQSFFVEANAAAPVLAITEECKSKSSGTFRSAEMNPQYLSIRMGMGEWQDETVLIKNESSTKAFDREFDAKKLRSPMQQAPYMATVDVNGEDLSINSIRSSNEEMIIPIRIEAGVSGVYTMELTGLSDFAKGACITLENVFTHTSYVLNEGTPIELPLEAGDRTIRYQLRVSAVSLGEVTDAGCATTQGGSAYVLLPVNTASVVEWVNESNTVFATTAPVDGIARVSDLASGNYSARITNNGACGVTAIDFEVLQLNKLGASAVVLPSTCEKTDDGGVSISISGGQAPYSILWNSGAEGQTIENVRAGIYSARVVDSNGCEGNFHFELQTASNLFSKFEVSDEQVEMENGKANIEFTNGSENAESFAWNFGDGSEVSADENPTHAYLSAGNYLVMLVASYETCEAVSTRTIYVVDESHTEEFASRVLGALTDRGVQLSFFFDEFKTIRINVYNVLGQQLIEPIIGQFGNETITFGDRRYAANALIEVTDVATGEKTLIRMGR